MKIFFGVPEFDGQLLRTLSYIPVGGADLGECLHTVVRIKEGDFDSWCNEWTNTADRLMLEAESSLAAGHLVSARSTFLRASNYYRTALFFLGGAPVDPRLVESYDKHVLAFAKAVELMPYNVQKVEIPFKTGFLSGFFYKQPNNDSPKPTILTFPGYDGTQQECYFLIAKDALERGYNVLCLDGPGHGHLLIKQNIYMLSEWDQVVTPAVDFLLQQPEVSPEQIALVGVSWGGMLAPLAATKEHRLAALVASPGQYDALIPIKKALPQIDELLQENNYTILDQILSQILADKMVAAKFKYKMWVHGVDSAFELIKAWTKFSLINKACAITCPTLVVDCENEPYSADQAKLLFAALQCQKEYILCKNVEGAGEHCGAGALTLINLRIFNWLDTTLKSTSSVGA